MRLKALSMVRLSTWSLVTLLYLSRLDHVRCTDAVFTLHMNELYTIEFSMEMLNQFYTCLCDYQDQSCTVLLERDIAFTYITRMISVSRFPSSANSTQRQIFSKNFVCTIPTSFNLDQMIGCIRLKKSENLCDNLELCESVNLVHGDHCEVGFAGIYWLYPGRIRQKIDNRYVSFSQCSQECTNASLPKNVINTPPPFLRTTVKTLSTNQIATSTSPSFVYTSTRAFNISGTSAALRGSNTVPKLHTENNQPFPGVNKDGKIIILIVIIIAILLLTLGLITIGIIICRKRRKNQDKHKTPSLTVTADPNTTLQYRLRSGNQRGQHRNILQSLSQGDSSSLSEFSSDLHSHSSSQEWLIAKRKAANATKESVSVVNNGFLFDINDNTFNTYHRQNHRNAKSKFEGCTFPITTNNNAEAQSVSSISGSGNFNCFQNSVTPISMTGDGMIYAKVDTNRTDLLYDDYDFSNHAKYKAITDDGSFSGELQARPVTSASYATVGEKITVLPHAYSRLNETVRVLTNPYNKLKSERDTTDPSKRRLKPYSITHLYAQSSVSIVGEEFYSNELVNPDLLSDSAMRSGYVNFKYGTLLVEMPPEIREVSNWTSMQAEGGASSMSSFTGDALAASSLPNKKHIYFELEKEKDAFSLTRSLSEEKMC
ncbi:uncharacterized protein LOC106072484 [Biomphalaria glabrata]|uniref:Uncharacterized protein LOC106072484 n=1 Tax=Biomphalaria glabrata TaxID=6526 RepID=A0A9W2YCS7_BIOGL|nr:uncharacterized protein LOC106072484 [Biomphalaria glabrata]